MVRAAVQSRPEILEAHLVAGGFDYLLKTRVSDMAAYRQFIGNVIWTLPGVLGVWLDRRYGTAVWAVLGLVLGFALGLWHLLRMTRRGPRSGDASDEPG